MKLSLSNRWFRQNLTRIAAAMIVAVLFKRKRAAVPEAVAPVRVPAAAEVAQLKQT